jgi:hypothetical protein
MDNMLNLTGMWAHPEREDVYSAKMQMGTVWLRRNPDKQDDRDPDKHPDISVCFSERKKKDS